MCGHSFRKVGSRHVADFTRLSSRERVSVLSRAQRVCSAVFTLSHNAVRSPFHAPIRARIAATPHASEQYLLSAPREGLLHAPSCSRPRWHRRLYVVRRFRCGSSVIVMVVSGVGGWEKRVDDVLAMHGGQMNWSTRSTSLSGMSTQAV